MGVLGGFVGLALGTMRLPALLLLGMPAPVAAGTNILVSTLSALTGMARHFREGRVNLRVVTVMGLPAVVGAFAGGFASDLAPEALLLMTKGLKELLLYGPLQLRRFRFMKLPLTLPV